MRTRKRICAAILTAVFAAVLCLTGCSLSPRLYEGVWAAENLQFDDLTIDRLEMTIERCPEKPAWNEYDTFTYYEGEGEEYFRLSFLVNGTEPEVVGAGFSGPDYLRGNMIWQGIELRLNCNVSGREGEVRFEAHLGKNRDEEPYWQDAQWLEFDFLEVL